MRAPKLIGYESEIRLFIVLLLILIIISPWGSLYLVQRTKLVLSQEFDQRLISVADLTGLRIPLEEIESIKERAISSEVFFSLQAVLRELTLVSGVERILFLDEKRRILLDSYIRDTYNKVVYFEGIGEASPTSPLWLSLRQGRRRLRSYLLPMGLDESPSFLLLVLKDSGYLNTLGRLLGFDIGMKIGGLAILLLLGILFVRLVLRPYRTIRETAREVGRVKSGEDDTEFMERTFRETVDRLRELASLGEMSAGIAHEFRNSLGSIMGYAQLVRREGPKEEIVEKMVGECHRFRSLLDEFLKFAKPADLRFELLDMREVLKESISSVKADKLSVSLGFEGKMPLVRGDRLLLRQVFSNLIQNSVEATPKGGSLTIRAETSKEGVEIGFRDTGGGIPKEDLNKVFIPFFSTKEEGIGLGLSLVRKIVTAHGGRVRIRSEEGEGTEVVISLPGSKPTLSL